MSKVSALFLANTIAHGQADATMVDKFYDDLMFDFSQQAIFTQVQFVPIVAGQAVYDFPDPAGQVIGVFHDDDMLSRLTLHELMMLDPNWRDRKGRPIGYVREEENDRRLRLYPVPDVSSGSFIFPTGMPLGNDYPTYPLVFVYGEARQDLPPWLDLALAYRILSREFLRESNHRDPNFGAACIGVADVLQGVLL